MIFINGGANAMSTLLEAKLVLLIGLLLAIIILYIILCKYTRGAVKKFFCKKWWLLLPLTLVVVFAATAYTVVDSAKRTEEDIKRELSEYITACIGDQWEADFSNISVVSDPSFSWNYDLLEYGRVKGEFDLIVNSDKAYPYMNLAYFSCIKDRVEPSELPPPEQVHESIIGISGIVSDIKYSLGSSSINFYPRNYRSSIKINSVTLQDKDGYLFTAECRCYDSNGNNSCNILMNGEGLSVPAEKERDKPVYNSDNSEKCYWCNGTGYMKYNYGESDLEAILSGHDPYTYSQCGSCLGTGKAR